MAIRHTHDSHLTLSIGIVKNNADPAQHGRLQVFIPSTDTPDFNVEDLPWATYVSPFAGVTANAKVGREGDVVPGATAYGMWAIPKNGSQVLVGFLEGDKDSRFWMGGFHQPQLNRSIPMGIEGTKSEIDESGLYPQTDSPSLIANLAEAGLGPGTDNFKTVGGYERSISHPSNNNINKPTDNGYAPKPLEPDKADSQMVALTTPGRHAILLSDVMENCRMRFKTTAGSQILIDDTNERIYVSSARGRNWVELDEGTGQINVYAASKVNIHAENDINLRSEANINISAKKRINIESDERGINMQAKLGLNFTSSEANVKISASRDLHLKTTNGPTGAAVSAQSTFSAPPYAGKGLGEMTDFPEEAGSGTSNMYLNSYKDMHVRADTGTLYISGKSRLDLRSVAGPLSMQSSGDVNLKADNSMKIQGKGIFLTGSDILSSKNIVTSSGPTPTSANLAQDAEAADISDVSSEMVVPDHEPWNRTEQDGGQTPRNKSYQG